MRELKTLYFWLGVSVAAHLVFFAWRADPKMPTASGRRPLAVHLARPFSPSPALQASGAPAQAATPPVGARAPRAGTAAAAPAPTPVPPPAAAATPPPQPERSDRTLPHTPPAEAVFPPPPPAAPPANASPAPVAAPPATTVLPGDAPPFLPAGTDAAESSPTPAPGEAVPALLEALPLYAENPPPHYPHLARERGWQGEVMLQVRVGAAGEVQAVRVQHSCGYPILDRAALEAVRAWRFLPARRGPLAVESEVRVPVRFRLERG